MNLICIYPKCKKVLAHTWEKQFFVRFYLPPRQLRITTNQRVNTKKIMSFSYFSFKTISTIIHVV